MVVGTRLKRSLSFSSFTVPPAPDGQAGPQCSVEMPVRPPCATSLAAPPRLALRALAGLQRARQDAPGLYTELMLTAARQEPLSEGQRKALKPYAAVRQEPLSPRQQEVLALRYAELVGDDGRLHPTVAGQLASEVDPALRSAIQRRGAVGLHGTPTPPAMPDAGRVNAGRSTAIANKARLELLPVELLHHLSQTGPQPLLSPRDVLNLRRTSRWLNFKLDTGLHRHQLLRQRLREIESNEALPLIEKFRSVQGLLPVIRDGDMAYNYRGRLATIQSLSGADEPMSLRYWVIAILQDALPTDLPLLQQGPMQRFTGSLEASGAGQAQVRAAVNAKVDEVVNAVEMIQGVAHMTLGLKPWEALPLLLHHGFLAQSVERSYSQSGWELEVRTRCGETALEAFSAAVKVYAEQNDAPWMMDLAALYSQDRRGQKEALRRVRQAFPHLPGGVRQLMWDTLALDLPNDDAGQRAHSFLVCCRLAEQLGASNAPSRSAVDGFVVRYVRCAPDRAATSALRRVVESSPPDKPFARNLAFALICALPESGTGEEALGVDHPWALAADAALRLEGRPDCDGDPPLRYQAMTALLRQLTNMGQTLWLPAPEAEYVLGRCLDTLEQRPLDMAWDRADIEEFELQFVLLRRARPEPALRALDRMLGLLEEADANDLRVSETVVAAATAACESVCETRTMPNGELNPRLQQPAVERALRLIGGAEEWSQPLGQLLHCDKVAASLSAQGLEALIAGSLQLLRQTDQPAPADQFARLWAPLFQLAQKLPVRSRRLAAADSVALAYVEHLRPESGLCMAIAQVPPGGPPSVCLQDFASNFNAVEKSSRGRPDDVLAYRHLQALLCFGIAATATNPRNFRENLKLLHHMSGTFNAKTRWTPLAERLAEDRKSQLPLMEDGRSDAVFKHLLELPPIAIHAAIQARDANVAKTIFWETFDLFDDFLSSPLVAPGDSDRQSKQATLAVKKMSRALRGIFGDSAYLANTRPPAPSTTA